MPTNPWDSDYKTNDLKEWHIATHGLTTKHTRHHHHFRLDQVKLKFLNAENSPQKWMNPSNRCVFCTPTVVLEKNKITTNHSGMGVGSGRINYFRLGNSICMDFPYPISPTKETPTFFVFFPNYLLLSNMTLLSSLRDRLSTCLCHQSIAIWIKGNEARTNPSENVVEANQRHAQHFFLFQFAKQKIKGKQEHEYLLSMYTEGCIYIHIIDIFINIINHNMWLM